jgi:hypothetical protein
LQAYERVVLLLERISPESLIMRTQKSSMSSKQFQSLLISSIRAEFEHNLSQQIYISQNSWEAVKNAKESIIKLINVAAARLKPEATSAELGKTILEMYVSIEIQPVTSAIKIVKDEISSEFM